MVTCTSTFLAKATHLHVCQVVDTSCIWQVRHRCQPPPKTQPLPNDFQVLVVFGCRPNFRFTRFCRFRSPNLYTYLGFCRFASDAHHHQPLALPSDFQDLSYESSWHFCHTIHLWIPPVVFWVDPGWRTFFMYARVFFLYDDFCCGCVSGCVWVCGCCRLVGSMLKNIVNLTCFFWRHFFVH